MNNGIFTISPVQDFFHQQYYTWMVWLLWERSLLSIAVICWDEWIRIFLCSSSKFNTSWWLNHSSEKYVKSQVEFLQHFPKDPGWKCQKIHETHKFVGDALQNLWRASGSEKNRPHQWQGVEDLGKSSSFICTTIFSNKNSRPWSGQIGIRFPPT